MTNACRKIVLTAFNFKISNPRGQLTINGKYQANCIDYKDKKIDGHALQSAPVGYVPYGFYEALAWEGLMNTTAFGNLSQAVKDQINLFRADAGLGISTCQ